ncbi:MAG: hypothetical protein Q8N63_00680 [Nanoarchaeota archaeon]|nr:hypothetical protein [Nanoarchaeota archaeon]
METIGDFLPTSILVKSGCTMPVKRVVVDRSLSKNTVYAPLVSSDTDLRFLDVCGNDELREGRAYVKVPAGMVVGENKKDFPKIPKDVLINNKWVLEKAVLSHFSPHYNPMAGTLNHEKWKFQDRVEIFGLFVQGTGVVELKPGVYELDFPGNANESALTHGVSVKDSNLGKNAFRYPNMKMEREFLLNSYGDSLGDEDIIRNIGRSSYAHGMELFFREDNHGRRPLYLMRPAREGVIDFIHLHRNDSAENFDEETGTIWSPKDDMGYWIGENGQFINWLSDFYSSRLQVKEHNPEKVGGKLK